MTTNVPNVPTYTGEVPLIGQGETEFSQNAQDSLVYQADLPANLNTSIAAMNTLGGEVEDLAASAELSNSQAAAVANFKGDWSGLTGALSTPASVKHNGLIWLLLNNLADVTASEPSVTADWEMLGNTASLKFDTIADLEAANLPVGAFAHVKWVNEAGKVGGGLFEVVTYADAISRGITIGYTITNNIFSGEGFLINNGNVVVVNDNLFGFQNALLSEAGIVPDGIPDKASESQCMEALSAIIAAKSVSKFNTANDLVIGAGADGVTVNLAKLAAKRSVVSTKWHNDTTKKGGALYEVVNAATYAATPDGYYDFYVGGGSDYVAVYLHGATIDYWTAGALLDGVSATDEAAVIAAHNYAKAKGLQVAHSGGVCLLSGTATVPYSVPASYHGGFKFKLDTDPVAPFVFSFEPEYAITTLNQGDVTIGDFVRHAVEIPSLSAYEYQYVTIKSNEVDLVRIGGQSQNKGDVTILGEGGEIAHPLTVTFGSLTEIKLSPILVNRIEISGLTIDTDGTVNTANIIQVSRNNVTLSGMRYLDSGTAASIAVQGLINLSDCFGFELTDPICESLSKGRVDYNYVLVGAYYCNVLVDGLTSFEGWAQVDGNYTRDVTVINSTIDRAGGHFHCYDYTFENIKTNRADAIDLAGGGQLNVSKIRIVVNDDYITATVPAAVIIRSDYGCEWDGQINVDDVLVDARGVKTLPSDLTYYGVNAYIDSSASGHDFGRDLRQPTSVKVSNVKLLPPINIANKLHLQSFRVGCGVTLAGGRLIDYPREVEIVGCSVINDGATVYNQNHSMYLLGGSPAKADTICKVRVRNCNNDDPRIFGLDPFGGSQQQNFSVDVPSGLSVFSESVDCDWERLNVTGDGKHEKRGGRVASVSGDGVVDMWDVRQAATQMSGTWRGAWFGGVVEAYFATDSSYKQVGFPNNIEDNLTAAKNVLTEVNGAIKSVSLTIAGIESGYKDAAYYQ